MLWCSVRRPGSWKLGELSGRYPNLCAGTGARGLECLAFTIDQFDLDAG